VKLDPYSPQALHVYVDFGE